MTAVDVRRLDFPEAELFISSGGDWRGFRSNACAKEPETAEWIRRVAGPGSVFYDVGACVGSYSLIAAALGASVHAFEPVAANYSQLQTNVWINELPRVIPWPVACTDRTASMQINLSSLAPGAASHDVQRSRTGFSDTGAHFQNAIGMGIDRFVDEFQISPPTDMKIDVDGGEVEVLQGSRGYSEACRA